LFTAHNRFYGDAVILLEGVGQREQVGFMNLAPRYPCWFSINIMANKEKNFGLYSAEGSLQKHKEPNSKC